MQSWAEEELKNTGLPDQRLNRPLIKIVEPAVEQPSATIPPASESWSDTKATYDFWKSERFDYDDLIEGHRQKTVQRAEEKELVLMIQDTSDFNFTHHRSKTVKRMERKAIVTICYTQVKRIKPQNLGGKTERESISVNAISVIEENPPRGEKGIEWRLLTTLPIANYDDALT